MEHFVDAEGKRHERFKEVEEVVLPFLDKTWLAGRTRVRFLSIGKAVIMESVGNETLGYFLARTYLFLIKLGLNEKNLRFRGSLRIRCHIMLVISQTWSY